VADAAGQKVAAGLWDCSRRPRGLDARAGFVCGGDRGRIWRKGIYRGMEAARICDR
jgi:hypothetical protein